MIGGIILIGIAIAIVCFVGSFGTAYTLACLLKEFIDWIGKYWNINKIFCWIVCLALTNLFYTKLTDLILMIFE